MVYILFGIIYVVILRRAIREQYDSGKCDKHSDSDRTKLTKRMCDRSGKIANHGHKNANHGDHASL